MKNIILLAVPVSIAAIVSCTPKNDLTAVKSSLDSLKIEWTKADSLVAGLDQEIKGSVILFQETFNGLAASENLVSIKDEKIKAEADSILVVYSSEINEVESSATELQALLTEWQSETSEFHTLMTEVEANTIASDSATLQVNEFKSYLATTGAKSAHIKQALEEKRSKNQLLVDEFNKRVNPALN